MGGFPGIAKARSLAHAAAGVAAVVTLVSSGGVALAHLTDRFALDQVAGTWIALAKYQNSGIFYPPLYDGHSFGGTRYMPLLFVVHATLERVLGDYVFSGKVLSVVAVGSLVGITFAVVRGFGVVRPVALLFASLMLLTAPGLQAVTSIRVDAAAAALQLGAVLLVHRRGPAAAVPAALITTLAVFAKFNAVWGIAAIGTWFFLHDRRALLWFVVTGFVAGASGLVIAQVVSDGRFLDNLGTLALIGVRGTSYVRSLTYTPLIFLQSSPAIWLLVPFAIGSCIQAIAIRKVTIYHLALFFAVLALFVTMSDAGAYINQLLDSIVLTSIVAAALWPTDIRSAVLLEASFVLVIAALWGALNGFVFGVRVPAQQVASALARGAAYPQPNVDALLARIGTGTTLLSEDPSIAVARGDLPVVVDAWMIPKLELRHPAWVAALVRRIESGGFDFIVLDARFESSGAGRTGWYSEWFGRSVMSAVAERYRWVASIDDFQLYQPVGERLPSIHRRQLRDEARPGSSS
jgi:hypothetical protein